MRHLYENGVWAIFSTLDPRVLQFKPGILLRPGMCEDMLEPPGRPPVLARRGRGASMTATAGCTDDPGACPRRG